MPTVKIEPHVLIRVTGQKTPGQNAASAAEARARLAAESAASEKNCSNSHISSRSEGRAVLSDAESFELRGTASSFGTHLADLPSGVTGSLVLADPLDAASDLRNPNECKGKIVVSWRGGCSFVDKVRRVQATGALACIVVQTGGVWPFSMSDTVMAGGDVVLPSLMISQEDGEMLKLHIRGITTRSAMSQNEAAQSIPDVAAPCDNSNDTCTTSRNLVFTNRTTDARRDEPSSELVAHAICRDHRTSCAVCMEELVASTLAVKLPCSHLFHTECLRVWLSKQHTCPTCRAKLPTRAEREEKESDSTSRSWQDYPLPRPGTSLHSAMYT
uniref:RING-type domain-containing protein n=1 Tax=Strombidinopsis acuminata TaxID=141414 RepID=A0A7S3RC64_9SPIT